MIDYIRYTIDGVTYSLINNGDGSWSKTANAPSIVGNYALVFEISENGIVMYIDSFDSRYGICLQVIEDFDRRVFLIELIPEFLREYIEFKTIFDIEDIDFDELLANVERVKNDMYITSASNDGITRLENFLGIKGQGTLAQRKSYLISLAQKGNRLNEDQIKEIANTISGSDCIVTFFASNELGNPEPGYGFLKIRVLSPDNNKDYKYDDIARSLAPLVPAHIKLQVIKYYATWGDIQSNYADWSVVAAAADWQAIKDYISP